MSKRNVTKYEIGGDNLGKKKRVKQDHYNYVLRDGRIIVKYGMTSGPNRRLVEMENKGLRFTSMTTDPVAVSKKTAREREKKRIKMYQRSHEGGKPRYNK